MADGLLSISEALGIDSTAPPIAPDGNLPRSVRNNNPGNLVKTGIPWQGKVAGTDSKFETFDTPENGRRALENNLLAYHKQGFDTVEKVIGRWAPASENGATTANYIGTVAKTLGVNPGEKIDLSDPNVRKVVADTITKVESGPISENRGVKISAELKAVPRRMLSLSEAGFISPPVATEKTTQIDDKNRTWGQFVGDTAINAARGVIGLGESVVGLGDMATGGTLGGLLSKIGFDPQAADQILAGMTSDKQQRMEREISSAGKDGGVWDGLTAQLGAIAENPSFIPGAVVQSLPLMLAAGGGARALAGRIYAKAIAGGATPEAAAAAVGKASGALKWAAAAGEGALSGGQTAEQAREAGRDWAQYVLPALAAGTGTAVIGRLAGAIPGLGDAETALFTRGVGGATGNAAVRTLKGAFQEGILEEMPQSMQEQIWGNVAQGKPPMEGVGAAGAQGAVVGAFTGAGAGILAGAPPQEASSANVPPSVPPGVPPEQTAPQTPPMGGPAASETIPAETAPPVTPIDQARADAELLRSGQTLEGADETRQMNATLMAVYGENAAVRHVIEAPDGFRAVGEAMMRVAPRVQQMRETMAAKPESLDVATDIVDALDGITRLHTEGKSVPEFLAKGIGHDLSIEAQHLMAFMVDNAGNSAAIADMLDQIMLGVQQAGGVPSEVRNKGHQIAQELRAKQLKADEEQQKADKEQQKADDAKRNMIVKPDKPSAKTLADDESKAERRKASEVARMEKQSDVAADIKARNAENKTTLTAIELAFQNAKKLKGKPNGKQSPENGGGIPAATPVSPKGGSGQGGAVAGKGSVSGAGKVDALGNAQPSVPQSGRTGTQDADKNRGKQIAAELNAVDQAAHEAATSHLNNKPQPTEKQKEAGNYAKGPVRLSGMDISIENPSGTKRRPEWPTLEGHYGYVKGVPARAPDKEHVDVFIKPGTPEDHNGPVFVIDQNHADGKFDEPKVMLGYRNAKEARTAYLKNYTKGWESRVRGIHEMTTGQFKEKLQDAQAFMKPQNRGAQIAKDIADRAAKATELRRLANEAGWAERGGKLLRSGEGASADEIAAGQAQSVGPVVGRTKWIPRAEWFQAMRQQLGNKGLSDEDQISKAAEDYLAGRPLKPNAQRTVDWMLEEIERERQDYAEQHQVHDLTDAVEIDDLVAADLEPAGDNLVIADLMAQAMAKDENATESATIQNEGDAELIAALQAIIAGAPKETVDRGAQGDAAAGEVAPLLTAPTADELRAKAAEQEERTKADEAAGKARAATEKAEKERKEIAQRSAAVAGDFTLESTEPVDKKTQAAIDKKKAEDSLAGIQDMFAENPVAPVAESKPVETFAGRAGKGISKNAIAEAIREQTRARPDLEWRAEPSNGLENPFVVSGYSHGTQTAMAQRENNYDPLQKEAIVVQGGIEGKTLAEAAVHVSKFAPDADQRLIAAAVADKIREMERAGTKFSMRIAHIGDMVPVSLTGSRGVTINKRSTNEVTVWLNGADVIGKIGMSWETVLHELIHAVTFSAVEEGNRKANADTPLGKDVADLYRITDAIIRHFNERQRSGAKLTPFETEIFNRQNNAFRDVHETLAWALTNRDAQQYLETIPYDSKQSFWGKLVTAVRKFLGLTEKADTALSEVLRIGERLLVSKEVASTGKGQMALFHVNNQQTLTEAFKRWFGDSKVVDAQGKPLVVYHGTFNNTDFNTFAMPAWFGDTPSEAPDAYAHTYTGKERGKEYAPFGSPRTMPVFLKITNPYDADTGELKFQGGYIDGETSPYNPEVVAFLESKGYDGVKYTIYRGASETPSETNWAVFHPEQIKSAIGNTGAFDPNDVSILRQTRTPYNVLASAPEWVQSQPSDMQETLRKAGAWRPHQPLRDRIASWTNGWQTKLKQGMVDQFDPLKTLDYHAYMLARMSKSSAGPLEAALFDGTVYLDKDGAVNVNHEKGGFIAKMQALKGEHDRFFSWVIGRRAELLMAEGREHNFDEADIARLKSLNDGKMADGSFREVVYAKALADLNRYNKSIMDMAEKAGLIDAETRPFWEKDFYIPFYRMTEGDTTQGPMRSSGLVRQYAFKTLKGGAQAIGDPMENILKNWAHLIDASLKNQAAVKSLDSAVDVGIAHETTSDEKGAVFVMKDGKKTYYGVDDPFVLDAINSLGFSGYSGHAMNIAAKFKRWLTYGVTISPAFRIRNIIRDSISMIGTNPASYNVLGNVLTGIELTKEGSNIYASMIAGGGVIRFGTMEMDGPANVRRLVNAGVDESTILDNPAKVKAMLKGAYDWWMKIGDRYENINRAALYQKLRDEGKSHLDASYAARDTMDFSMMGTWSAIRFLSQTVPFFNARLQGTYKLARGAAEDPQRFAYVVGAAALASIALLLAFGDDDDWKQREDWDRETYWWFKVGGVAFRIPKPFEIGAIATLAERAVETMTTNELSGKQFFQRMGAVVGQQLSMNPVPQLIMPMIELWANRSAFTGRSIETQGMERLSPHERIGPATSAFAQLAGKNNVISPVQIDHIINGYFGWLGMHAVATADLALRPTMSLPGKPAMRVDETFLAGDFIKSLPSYQSKYVTRLYDQGKQVQEVLADMHHFQKTSDMEKAREILTNHRAEIRQAQIYTHAEQQLSAVNNLIKVAQSNKADADTKRKQLDALYQVRNRIAMATERRAQEIRQ